MAASKFVTSMKLLNPEAVLLWVRSLGWFTAWPTVIKLVNETAGKIPWLMLMTIGVVTPGAGVNTRPFRALVSAAAVPFLFCALAPVPGSPTKSSYTDAVFHPAARPA